MEPEHRPCPLENPRAGIGIDISPMPAASWPNACATFAPAGKRILWRAGRSPETTEAVSSHPGENRRGEPKEASKQPCARE